MSEAFRGSQKWIQWVINRNPEILNRSITSHVGPIEIEWVSPLEKEDYVEYSDNKFLEKLNLTLSKRELRDFWPMPGGPKWDALGKTPSGTVFLVEAKSHIGEINVYGTRASGTSPTSEKNRQLIKRSLDKTKSHLNARKEIDWSSYYYQYANRLAHLYLLKELNSIDAYLIMVYFLNDQEQGGPTIINEWKGAIQLLKNFLGINNTKLDPYIIEAFIDIQELM